MAAPFSLFLLIHCAIFLIVCPLSSYAAPEAIDIASKCPHVLTPTSIKQHPPSNNGTFLVVVPWKVGFEQFVRFNPETCFIDGFSVQVFLSALRRMPRHGPRYQFVLYGDGKETPVYDDMINMVYSGEVDAVVADLTITQNRMQKVGFTMPYMASQLVMVTPFRYGSAGTLWDFLKPFSMQLWLTLLACFVATGFALYLLENENPDFSTKTKKLQICNDASSSSHGGSKPHGVASPSIKEPSTPTPGACELANINTATDNTLPPALDPSSLQASGPPIYQASHRRRILNAYWFTSLCVFEAQQESVRTHLGRFVTVVWLFVTLIFNSSYTASLASILSAQQSYPMVAKFQDLLDDKSILVGYQEGSFMKQFMKSKQIDESRLKNFGSENEYARALRLGDSKPGGVGVVLDELPYIQILLQSECFLTKSSDNDYHLSNFGGFAFAFRKNSSYIEEISRMIVAMEEDGTLKELQNRWNIGGIDHNGGCSSNGDASRLRLRSFGGLISILCGVYVLCIGWRVLVKVGQPEMVSSRCIGEALSCIQGGCNICKEASIRRHSGKVSDVSLEHDSS